VIASVDADISTTLQGILLSFAKSLFTPAKLPGSFLIVLFWLAQWPFTPVRPQVHGLAPRLPHRVHLLGQQNGSSAYWMGTTYPLSSRFDLSMNGHAVRTG
jgi:hypothetical protein